MASAIGDPAVPNPVEPYAALPRWWLTGAATAAVGLGLLAFIGWIAGAALLTEPLPGFPPLKPFFAVGLTVVGVCLLTLARRLETLGLIGGFALIVLGIIATAGLVPDQWPLQLQAEPSAPRPALARGLILILSGISVMLTILAPRWVALWNVVGLTGVTLLAMSTMMLVARLLGLVEAVDSPMSLLLGASSQMTLGALLGGATFTRMAWRDIGFAQPPPAWLPWAGGFSALLAVVFLWRALVLNEAADLRHVVHAVASSGVARLSGPLESALGAVDQVAARTRVLGQPMWTADSSAIRAPLGLSGMAVSDTGGSIAAVTSETVWDLFDRDTLTARLVGLGARKWPDRMPGYLRLGRDRFAAVVPVYVDDRHVGFAIGLMSLQLVLPSEVVDRARFGYQLSFGDQIIAGDDGPDHRWLERADLYASTPSGRLSIWPQGETLNGARSSLPNVVFAFGLAVAVLIPLTLQLARTAWSRARVIERGQLYEALERGADGIWEMDLVRGTIRPSPTLWQHLGYPVADRPVTDGDWQRLIHPDDLARYRVAIRQDVMEPGKSFEVQYRLRAHDGSWHWLVERGRVTERNETGAPTRMLGIIGDITERRRVEDAQAASEQRYRATFESAFQFQALLAPDGSIVEVNRTALGYGGVTLDDVRGKPFSTATWWQLSPDAQRRIDLACRAAAGGRIQQLEVEADGHDGNRVTLDLSIKPLLGPEGGVDQLLVEGRDLTERKRAEKVLREVEIMATMGRVAAKVAHEINNPLAGIQNSFLLVKDAIPTSHPHYRYVGAIEREIGRISGVTRQLYETFRTERNGGGELPESVIVDTVALIRELNRNAGVNVITELNRVFPEGGAVPAAIIRQTVYNLVQNAVDASPPGGEVRVSTHAVPGGYEIRVRDQGPGVPDVVRERIFDPFYTTKPQGLRPGEMGLGLYLVRRSVEALGGTVRLISPPDGGTEFIIWFPAHRSSISGA